MQVTYGPFASVRKLNPSARKLALLAVVAATLAAPTAAAPTKDLPTRKVLQPVIERHFRGLPDYQNGDMLSRGQVEPLFALLAKQGWTVSDHKEILAHIVADDAAMMRHLRTEKGYEFMRKIADKPGAYDRLHRLAMTANGSAQVRDLIKLPNAPQVMEALTSSRGGQDIARRLARGPNTPDYDKNTGYLYTEKALVERLWQSYASDQEAQTSPPQSKR